MSEAKPLWSSGNYDPIGKVFQPVSQEVLGLLAPERGELLLDVGTGTGNLAVIAAESGATVTGLDLDARQLDQARRRADAAGLAVEWIEADAQAMPFADAAFDMVGSVLGVMFAPDHQKAASEMLRVTKPGGRIAVATWTPTSFFGRSLEILMGALGRTGEQPFPIDWARAEHVEELFADATGTTFTTGELVWKTGSVTEAAAFLDRNAPPHALAAARLGDRWPAMQEQLRALLGECNSADDGTCELACEYLIAVARR